MLLVIEDMKNGNIVVGEKKEFCMWSGLIKIRLKLIKYMNFVITVSYCKTRIWFSLSIKKTRFSWNAAFDNRSCEFLCL